MEKQREDQREDLSVNTALAETTYFQNYKVILKYTKKTVRRKQILRTLKRLYPNEKFE